MNKGKVLIGNLRNPREFGATASLRVDRATALGNPFYMHDESERDAVCDRYESYFPKLLATNHMARQEIIRAMACLRRGEDLVLLCWCAPKRCHAETIRRYLLAELAKEEK